MLDIRVNIYVKKWSLVLMLNLTKKNKKNKENKEMKVKKNIKKISA